MTIADEDKETPEQQALREQLTEETVGRIMMTLSMSQAEARDKGLPISFGWLLHALSLSGLWLTDLASLGDEEIRKSYRHRWLVILAGIVKRDDEDAPRLDEEEVKRELAAWLEKGRLGWERLQADKAAMKLIKAIREGRTDPGPVKH